MSSILKALKKLEQNKALRRENDLDLTWFVRGDMTAPPGRRYWPLIVALVSVAAVAVLATYWVMLRVAGPSRQASTVHPAGGNVAASAVAPSHEPAVAATPTPARPPAASPAPSAEKPAADPGELHPQPTKPRLKIPAPPKAAAAKSRSGVAGRQGNPLQVDQARPKQRKQDAGNTAQSASPEPAVARPVPSRDHPALHVAGIAWQKDSSNPMAIVNGSPVVEGSTIEGARVEKIFQERVQFSYKGRSFDVGLGASSNGR